MRLNGGVRSWVREDWWGASVLFSDLILSYSMLSQRTNMDGNENDCSSDLLQSG
jgi:hypothetical protein